MPLRFSTDIKIILFEGGFRIELHCVCAIIHYFESTYML